MALFAKQKGSSGSSSPGTRDPYWAAYAADVGSAAKSLGIQIAGAAPFDPEARNYTQFARRIAATRADGVALASLPPSTPALLRDLRAGLGRRVTLIGGEDFLPIFTQSGPEALGVYLAYPGAGHLAPPPGRKTVPEGSQSPHRQAKPVLHRLRRPVSRDPARRDRPLRRHPRLSHQRAVQDESRERHPRRHPLRQERRPGRSTRHHLAHRTPLARTERLRRRPSHHRSSGTASLKVDSTRVLADDQGRENTLV